MTQTAIQQRRIEAMRAEFASMGGTVTTFEELPPDIEEEALRQALNRPDRGFLYRRDHGIPESEATS